MTKPLTHALKVIDLKKRFCSAAGSVTALDGISFEVQKGEVFGFLGPNGSGKSTTLNAIANLILPDSGEVELLGKKLGERGYFDHVAFMSGDSEFLWSFTGHDIIDFYQDLSNASSIEVKKLIDRLDMGEKLYRKWTDYSNGEKTKIRLIRALMKRPQMLFLDEPTVGLDPNAAIELRRYLREVNTEGITILLTSHYMKDIEELADRVCFIRNGRVERIAPLADFRSVEGYFVALSRDEVTDSWVSE